ncbi:MAG: L-lactate permease [Clostridia bacterium]|nr:L-lactate permease [Clostridia bacterium]
MDTNVYEVVKKVMAFIPLIWLLFSLGKIRMPAYRAAAIGLILTLAIALFAFKMPAVPILQASTEGVMLALFPILWVIVSALFVYNITVATGGMEQIKQMLSGLSPDRRIQSLVLAFGFGGFLEAVAGFGTAVAIPAGILAAMGFNPLLAATICLIANTIPVAFGVLGIPVVTLAQVTSLPVGPLSVYTALQLVPFVVVLPIVLIAAVTGSIKNVKGVFGVSIASGTAFALAQTLTTIKVGPELAAVAGSLATLAVIVIWVKLFPVKNIWLFKGESLANASGISGITPLKAAAAWSPYLLILAIILITKFVPFLSFLNEYPFVLHKQFYFGHGGKALAFQLVTGGGTVLFISAIIGGIIQGASIKKIFNILVHTVKQMSKTFVTVISIVVLAKVMGYSGMVNSIAAFLAAVSGGFYPFIAPLIGALGTFLTGSDTSSNVLFGNLQKQTALQLSIDPEWLTAANASGATAGKMISPQSISIATAATGLSGSEGKILGTTVKYCIVYVILMGILIYAFSFKTFF